MAAAIPGNFGCNRSQPTCKTGGSLRGYTPFMPSRFPMNSDTEDFGGIAVNM